MAIPKSDPERKGYGRRRDRKEAANHARRLKDKFETKLELFELLKEQVLRVLKGEA